MSKGLINRIRPIVTNGNNHRQDIPMPRPELVANWLNQAIGLPAFVRYGLKVIERGGITMVCRLTSTDPIGVIHHPTPTRSLPIIHIYNHLFRTLVNESENDELINYVRVHTQA